MLAFLFYCFLAYLAYNLVFRFIIPIYRTTRQVKRGFREMHERMQHGAKDGNGNTQKNTTPSEAVNKTGEYIDFEEVKE